MGKPERLKTSRPGSVVVAGWCAILAVPLILARLSMIFVLGELEAIMANASVDPASWITPEGLELFVMALVVPIATVSLFAGIAILRLKRWAWVVLMLFLLTALLLNLLRAYFQEPEYALMLIYAVLVLILNQPDVRRAFRVGRPAYDTVE